jgi:hypothetical protein
VTGSSGSGLRRDTASIRVALEVKLAEPRLLSMLEELGYRTISIIRDPRDVVVSSVFYFSGPRRRHL